MITRNQIEIVITGVLVVIFVFTVSINIKRSREKMRKQENKKVVVEGENSRGDFSKETVIMERERFTSRRKQMSLEWGRDPFFLPQKVSYKKSVFSLRGISIGRDKAFAFINDQIVTTGDTIEGWKVVEIKKERVLLIRGKEKFYLTLPEEESRTELFFEKN